MSDLEAMLREEIALAANRERRRRSFWDALRFWSDRADDRRLLARIDGRSRRG